MRDQLNDQGISQSGRVEEFVKKYGVYPICGGEGEGAAGENEPGAGGQGLTEIDIDGVKYTPEQIKESISKAADYTQKTQTLAQERETLKADREALDERELSLTPPKAAPGGRLQEVLGDEAAEAIKGAISEGALAAVAPLVTPLTQTSILARKDALKKENPKLWEQIEPEIEKSLSSIRLSGYQPLPQDVDAEYDRAIGRLARAGKLPAPKSTSDEEILGEVPLTSPQLGKGRTKIKSTPKLEKEQARLGLASIEDTAEVLEYAKKVRKEAKEMKEK